jgi:hypothetical protein
MIHGVLLGIRQVLPSLLTITVDHSVWPSADCVQCRGCGNSNRFLHSAEVAHFSHTMELLVPYLDTLPFWVDRCCSNETCLTRDPSIVPPTIILPRSHALGGLCVTLDTCHRRGQLNCPKRGRRQITHLAHKVIVAYLIRVACTHNLPSLVVPIKEHVVRPSEGRPIPTDVAARVSLGQWHLINH